MYLIFKKIRNLTSQKWGYFTLPVLIGFFLVFSGGYLRAFALGSPFAPNTTLDPACNPETDSNCFVQFVPNQTGHGGEYLSTDGTNTVWSPLSIVGIAGTISAHQIAFGSSTSVIAGSNNFTFTDGIYPSFQVGDVAGVGNKTVFSVNDASSTISATGTFSLIVAATPTVALSIKDTAGNSYFTVNATTPDSNFFGHLAGSIATNANYSNFFGDAAGQNSTNANYSNFMGYVAGAGAPSANNSNFFGWAAGNGAANANNSNFLGQSAGDLATDAYNSNFLGYNAGSDATNSSYSNFIGSSAGQNAYNATSSNFLGKNAGNGATNANNSNFIGNSAGSSAYSASYSNFIGWGAGYTSPNANNSNFFGTNAGNSASGANDSNFIGWGTGNNATNADHSNFIGFIAGYGAANAKNSDFFGTSAGNGATNASSSTFIGYQAGYQAVNANNSIFIGNSAGANDLVNNTSGNTNSILIGDRSSTGGFPNSVAIGTGAVNTTQNQFLIRAANPNSFTDITLDASSGTTTVLGDFVVSVGGGGTCVIGSGSTALVCSSDQRLKTNINDLPDSLAQINQLRPVTYNWINPKSGSNTNIGFIAQDMQKVFPEFVNVVDPKTGYLGINYAGLTAPIVKAIQQLDVKVEPLTSLDINEDGSLASLIRSYLQNAANGISTIFADKVQTKQLCLEDVCVTKTQLQQLLDQANVQNNTLISTGSSDTSNTSSTSSSATTTTGNATSTDVTATSTTSTISTDASSTSADSTSTDVNTISTDTTATSTSVDTIATSTISNPSTVTDTTSTNTDTTSSSTTTPIIDTTTSSDSSATTTQ